MRGDLEWGTIPGLLDSAAERFGAREAVVDGDMRITFEHLRVAARHAARAAIAMGVEPGDRVAIWAPNIHEWIVAALGALHAGGVLVPINTRFKGREAGFVLQKSRARLLFTRNDRGGLVRTSRGANFTTPRVLLPSRSSAAGCS